MGGTAKISAGVQTGTERGYRAAVLGCGVQKAVQERVRRPGCCNVQPLAGRVHTTFVSVQCALGGARLVRLAAVETAQGGTRGASHCTGRESVQGRQAARKALHSHLLASTGQHLHKHMHTSSL